MEGSNGGLEWVMMVAAIDEKEKRKRLGFTEFFLFLID